MSTTHVVVEGMLKPVGSLEVAQKLGLPPGRVRVTIEMLNEHVSPGGAWFAYLQAARADRESAGVTFRTKEQIDTEINTMRDEWDRPKLDQEWSRCSFSSTPTLSSTTSKRTRIQARWPLLDWRLWMRRLMRSWSVISSALNVGGPTQGGGCVAAGQIRGLFRAGEREGRPFDRRRLRPRGVDPRPAWVPYAGCP